MLFGIGGNICAGKRVALPTPLFTVLDRTAPFAKVFGQFTVHSFPKCDPGGMMLKKYQNDGDYNHGQIGTHLSGKFFDGKFAFSISPRLMLYNTTGSHCISHNSVMVSLSADYYLSKLFFNVYYDSGWSYVDGENAYLRKMPMSYSISAGWASRGWNIHFSLVNLFQSSWKLSNDTLSTRWYDSKVTQFGSDYHRRISLSVTYTFNYGKKVNTSEELNSAKNISTSILH